MVSSVAWEGKLHLSENTESEGRCRAGQRNLHGLKILIYRTRRKQGPAPSFVRSGTCFHSNQAGCQRQSLWRRKSPAEVFPASEATEARFVGLSDPRQSRGPERRLRFRPSHPDPAKGIQRWGPGSWLSFTLLPLETSSASGCYGNYDALGSQREIRDGKIRPVNRHSNNNKLSLCTPAYPVTSLLPFTKPIGGLLTHNLYCHCTDQMPGTHLTYKWQSSYPNPSYCAPTNSLIHSFQIYPPARLPARWL